MRFAYLSLLLVVSVSASKANSASIRSAPAAKGPVRAFSAKTATPLVPTLKSHVHQRTVELLALSSDTLQQLRQQSAAETGKRLRIGIARDFSDAIVVNAQTAPSNSWTLLPDGSRIWTIQVTSHGALGLRVHVENLKLDPSASLIVYNPNSPAATAAKVPTDTADDDSGVWAPTVFGEDVVIECQLPAGVDPASTAFSVTGVSHRYRGNRSPSLAQAGACEHDVVCQPDWFDTGQGIASIDFVDKGATYLCTGCLLNDSDPETFVNYFLTAHHCVGNKKIAATVEALWFYQATICDNPSSIDNGTLISGGADLLATSATSDFAFLRLRAEPPNGVTYEGWTTSQLSSGDSITGIHHPEGDIKKISFGDVTDHNNDFWRVEWHYGITEGGSSGSPLFNADHAVTGQLFGGASACDFLSGEDDYGRFDVTYQKIHKWIDNYAFLRMQGVYNGLFADSGNLATESSGFFSLTLRDQGSFSAGVLLGGKKYSVSGQFDRDAGTASADISRPGMNSLTLEMTLDVTLGAEAITGTVSDGTWTAGLLAKRAAFNSKTNAAPFAPKYTLIFPGADSSTAPRGDGFAAINVDANGKFKLSGSLAEGTKVVQAISMAPDRTVPLYANLYGGKGVLEGWLSFDDNTPANDLNGSVSWIKDAQSTARLYPAGFSLDVSAMGFVYTPPGRMEQIIPITTGTIFFSGGNLSSDFSNDLSISADNKVSNEGANKLSMSFVLPSGLFNGSVMPPSGGKAIPFHGAVLQSTGEGYGYFLGSSESGRVSLQSR